MEYVMFECNLIKEVSIFNFLFGHISGHFEYKSPDQTN